MESLFLKLLNMSITAGWLVLAVVLLRLVLKKAPKAIICGLWALVALRLIFPFSVESMFSLIPNPEPVTDQIVYVNPGAVIIPNEALEQAPTPSESAVKEETNSLLTTASIIWLAGMGVMAGYAFVSYLLLLRRTREGVEREKGVWLCDRIESPFILGVIKPRIFLPSSIDSRDAQFVLAHERAHLKRLDHLWKPLGFLLLTVYWFNPLLWLAYILLCRDIELACDEKVLHQLGTACKQDYSTALINCSVPRRMIAACPLAFGEVGVKGRIKSILNYKKPAFWIILVALVASIVVAVCFLTNPEREEKPESKTVTVEVVSQQGDSVTVEWVNDSERLIIIGYDKIFIKRNDQWVEHVTSLQGIMTLHGWTRSLEPGETYQQIVYHYFVGISEPGEYRLDMKYTDDTGAETILPLEFTVTEVTSNIEDYDGPVWSTKLICEESPDPLKPTILLSDDGQFQFQFAGYSSYIARGSYEENSRELILETDDESGNVYRFKKEGWMTYRFDAANSTQLPQYKYDGVVQSPVPDGGLFEPISNDGRIIAAASVPAHVDSDNIPEYWTVIYQPSYGFFAFEITAADPEGAIMYRDVFQYEFSALSIQKNADGDIQLCVVTADAENPVVFFDISVVNGHIRLTREQGSIPQMITSEATENILPGLLSSPGCLYKFEFKVSNYSLGIHSSLK